jgi:hypothetical protein
VSRRRRAVADVLVALGGAALVTSAFAHWVSEGAGSGLRGHALVDAIIAIGRHLPGLSAVRITVLWYLVPASGAASWAALGLSGAASRATRVVAIVAALVTAGSVAAIGTLAGYSKLGFGAGLAVAGAGALVIGAWVVARRHPVPGTGPTWPAGAGSARGPVARLTTKDSTLRLHPARPRKAARRPAPTGPRRAGAGSSRIRSSLALALVCICTSGLVTAATTAGASSGPTLKGPILSRAENPSTSWVRDGGVSLPLPNGKDFWIFGDSPRYHWSNGGWKMNAFIYGSTAAQRAFTSGKPLDGPLTEVWAGHPTKTTNQPRQFLPLPKLYLPDGSGRGCTRANGARFAVRWVTGAALMPDKTKVFIPYVEVCVMEAYGYVSEGWGFTLYDYKTNKFSMKPYAVFPPSPDGTAIPSSQVYGSPIIRNGKVTFYSWDFGSPSGGIYATQVNATVAALKNPASYAPALMPDLPQSYNIHVVPPAKGHTKITMYMLRGNDGEYELYSASAPKGPWSNVGSGQLPNCDRAFVPCRSFALHPELSPAKRMMVSYYLHGYGPGIPTKHPESTLPHAVMASLPCNC